MPVIGRSLLGDAEYENLRARLEPGQHALLIAANGLYSFKGSGFVRGGIFDRIQLVQGDGSTRFRDRQYKHLGEVAADMAQPFAEVGLFVVPTEAEFDPDRAVDDSSSWCNARSARSTRTSCSTSSPTPCPRAT